MDDFSDGLPTETTNWIINRNVYWNKGAAIPADIDVLNYFDDKTAILGNPVLPAIGTVVLPRWNGSKFLSGSSTIQEEHTRLVNTYGVPGTGSVAIGAGDPLQSPPDDILKRARSTTKPTIGAVEQQSTTSTGGTITVKVALNPSSLVGGKSSTLNQVVLSSPAPAGGVSVPLVSSNPTLMSVPTAVTVLAGQTSANFTITTRAVTSTTNVAVNSTYTGVLRYMATLTITP
jgi:hypothetical protein